MKHAVGRTLGAGAITGLAYAAVLVLASTLLYVVTPTAALAQPITSDSRIKTFVYNPNEVFSITTHYGYQSNIEFALKESIETISVGDRVGWQVVPAGRRLFIRAMEENARTNMTVVTNLRAYQFELRSSSASAVFGSEALTYVVRFFYPSEATATGVPQMPPTGALTPPASAAINPATLPTTVRDLPAPVATPLAAPASTPVAPAASSSQGAASRPSLAPSLVPPPPAPEPLAALPAPTARAPITLTPPPPPPAPAPKQEAATPNLTPLQPAAPKAAPMAETSAPGTGLNYQYTFSGPNAVAPTKIFDDGKTTYFKLPSGETPTFEIITSRGASYDVPSRRTRDGLVAVDMVAQNFRLKQAGSEVLVYNEASSGVN